MTTDYTTLPNARARSETVIDYAKEHGHDRSKTLAAIAVSWQESAPAASFAQKRVSGLYDPRCWPNRVPVGLELDGSGKVPVSWSRDQSMWALLLSNNLVNPDGTPRAALSSPPNNENIANLLEYTILRRYAPLLDGFSVGPTQMFMGLSKIRLPSSAMKFPDTWEALFKFYAPQSEADILNGITYLPALPAIGASLDTCQQWLQRYQTGTRAWTDPFWDSYSKKFQTASNEVQTIANSRW